MIWEGVVEDGQGIASGRLSFPTGWHPGTLNLRGEPISHIIRPGWEVGWEIEYWMPITVRAELYYDRWKFPVIAGVNTEDNTVEVASKEHLRTALRLNNGDRVFLTIDNSYVL